MFRFKFVVPGSETRKCWTRKEGSGPTATDVVVVTVADVAVAVTAAVVVVVAVAAVVVVVAVVAADRKEAE